MAADPDEDELDEGAAADEDVLVGADEDADADVVGVGDTDVVAVGDVDVRGVADVVGVADLVGVAAGDEYVLGGWDVPEYGAELDGDGGGAAGVVDADEASGPTDTDAGAVAGDVCAAGDSSGAVGPLMVLTTKAVAPPAPTMPPRIRASTSGFTRRRRGGRALGAGGGVAGP